MSDAPRTITGVFRTPEGVVVANRTLTWYRAPRKTRAQGSSVIVDELFRTSTDAAGAINVAVVPGNYLVMVRLGDADRYFEVGVPDGTGALNISDLIDTQVAPITPSEVLEARQYRDESRDARDVAREWATNPEDDPVLLDPEEYSARHWAAKAALIVGAAESEIADEIAYAEEWAQSGDPISVDAGGDGVSDRSAKWWAQRAIEFFAGTWDSGTSYTAGQVVISGGSLWLALRPSTNVTPAPGLDWALWMSGVTAAEGSVGLAQRSPSLYGATGLELLASADLSSGRAALGLAALPHFDAQALLAGGHDFGGLSATAPFLIENSPRYEVDLAYGPGDVIDLGTVADGKQLKLRRHSTALNDAFLGLAGELTVDTQRMELRLHDSETEGGATIPGQSSGSWTPILAGASTPGSPTYAAQSGYYVTMGRLVFVSLYLAWSAKGGISGPIMIPGSCLPFASLTDAARRQGLIVPYWSNFLLGENERNIKGLNIGGNIRLYTATNTTGNVPITDAHLGEAGAFYATMTYETEQ